MKLNVWAATGVMVVGIAAWAGPRIAVLDQERQGPLSLGPSTGTAVSQLKASILSTFPGAVFNPMPALTTEGLGSNDLVVLLVAGGPTGAVTLSVDERSALGAFVAGGRGAVVFADNDTFVGAPASAEASNSMSGVFGVTMTGTGLGWEQSATVASPLDSALTHGIAGDVTSWSVGWSGWFSHTGGGHVRGTLLENGQAALVEFLPGELGVRSGPVVLFADTTMAADGAPASNYALMTNAIDAAWGRCGSADVGSQGGIAGSDRLLNNNDFVVFIGMFFTQDAGADFGMQGGMAGHDGLFNNNDFVVFINEFFGGCG